MYRLPESSVGRNTNFEYGRSIENSLQMKIGPSSWIGEKLREFLGWKEIDGSQEAAIYCVKTKETRYLWMHSTHAHTLTHKHTFMHTSTRNND